MKQRKNKKESPEEKLEAITEERQPRAFLTIILLLAWGYHSSFQELLSQTPLLELEGP